MSDTQAQRRDPAGAIEVPNAPIDAAEILAVRRGPGANCSSIGSALDLLFLSAVAAGAVLAGIAAAFGDEGREERREGEAEADDEGSR